MLSALPNEGAPPSHVEHAIASWATRRSAVLGPASSVRAVTDTAVIPLLAILGLTTVGRRDADGVCQLEAAWRQRTVAPIIVVPWAESLDSAWRLVVRRGIHSDARWCFSCNGKALRIVDGHHTWTRHYLEFDLDLLPHEIEARRLLWTLARGEALAASPAALDEAVERSAAHGMAVCRMLGSGVLRALELLLSAIAERHRRRHPPDVIFDQCLTVLYRVLFLLFAEARGLVPMWHPIYRDRYSIDAIVTTLLKGRTYRGVWSAVQAISRIAHAGCAAGELTVTAFNGRLFSPSRVSVLDGSRLTDEAMGRVVMAVSTTPATKNGGIGRIAYGELDVEQLGAVYERLLDYDFQSDRPIVTSRSREARKSSGTFYTPRGVTAFLVRKTLEPLVRDRSSSQILQLRIVDPAMGSGAFLVESCRFLAAAVEEAYIREGRWHPADILAADRAEVRREIALRCLYGVDLNPMAVQLARLSIWLATLASEKPLTFLDHHLVAGNSLIGATPDDIRRRPGRVTRRRRPASLPLFDEEHLAPVLENAVGTRVRLAAEPDDSAAIVHEKERTLARLLDPHGDVARCSRVLDLWCAGWFGPEEQRAGSAFADLAHLILDGRSSLPERAALPLLRHSEDAAARYRFLHWPLTFPEVFADDRGHASHSAGFDAVIGNPPWDMIRGDSGDSPTRAIRRREAQHLADFVRESGVYRVESRSHANRYQLFAERATQLVKHDGRIGLVLPGGIAIDAGAAPLRRYLFDRAAVDSITGIDNRTRIFPIHRSVRFVLLTCTSGRPTTEMQCRFGITSVDELSGRGRAASGPAPLTVTREFLVRASGPEDLGIPELAGASDFRIVEKISATIPWLGSADGWNVRFGRELNASDDRPFFVPVARESSGRPVLEGKQLDPFRVSLDKCALEVAADAEPRIRVPRRARLAFRDVASATNRLTLIAAIVPAHAVTTHTLFCLKEPLPLRPQQVLCALLNSFVANYLVRLRVNTHVTTALVARLPVPVVPRRSPAFARLAALANMLMAGDAPTEEMTEYAELQAIVAHLYGLDEPDFARVLSTFPLISQDTRAAALDCFTNQ